MNMIETVRENYEWWLEIQTEEYLYRRPAAYRMLKFVCVVTLVHIKRMLCRLFGHNDKDIKVKGYDYVIEQAQCQRCYRVVVLNRIHT